MKLKNDFVMTKLGENSVLVPVGDAAQHLHAVVRLNETAAFIVDELRWDTSREMIVDAVLMQYDVERDVADENVGAVLDRLREIGALAE